MKKSVLLLLFTTSNLLFSCSNGQTQNSKLTATDFAEKIKKEPSIPVVDVRTPEEFSKGHIQNAKNIDWNGNDFQIKISKLDKSKPVFIYCLSGGRSSAAASQMRSDGFKEVYELSGGIMKWRAADLPETTDNTTSSSDMSK